MTQIVVGTPYRIQSRSENSGAATSPLLIPTIMYVLSTFLQRLGYWYSTFPLPAVMVFSPTVLGIGLLKGRIEFSGMRVNLFIFLAGCILISTLLGTRGTLTSTIAYFVLYVQWTLRCRMKHDDYIKYLHRIAILTSILCIVGMLQWLAQYVIKSPYIFSWRGIVPPELLLEQNSLNELTYNSGQYKGNGFFLTEPSSLSGLAARVLLLTVLILKDLRYVVPLVLGLIFSFSGTGLVFMLLFTALPLGYLLFEKGSKAAKTQPTSHMVVAAVAAIVIGVLFMHYSDYFVGRVDELSNPRTSGYARYTTTLLIFREEVMRTTSGFLFGYGPGSFDPLTGHEHSTGWIKLFVEVGLIGTIAFITFFLVCVYSSTRSLYISVAMLFHYIVLDSPVLSPQFTLLAFAMFVLPVREIEPDESARHE